MALRQARPSRFDAERWIAEATPALGLDGLGDRDQIARFVAMAADMAALLPPEAILPDRDTA